VKKRCSTPLETLRRTVASTRASDIDRLYGLEPVYEPGKDPHLAPEECVAIRCPYCGERLETRIDLTAGERSYIEDCQVCCRPIELCIELTDGGALYALKAQRLD
jgi:hypothetical protein